MAAPRPGSDRGFRNVSTYITGHDEKTRRAIILKNNPAEWQAYAQNSLFFHLCYTTSQQPPSVNGSADFKEHEAVVSNGNLGLTQENGTVLRMTDFAPGTTTMMHRTKSLDYGIVVEGNMELVLDGGEVQVLGRGDVVVQRGTNHAWRNPSETEWGRMVFCLMELAEPAVVGGEILGEDYVLEKS